MAENNRVGNIQDELTEILFLKKPKILVFEWLPFDSNQLRELTRKLDIEDGSRKTLVTAMIDKEPESPVIVTTDEYTRVQLVEYEEDSFISIIAKILLPEEESITQIEELSAYISVSGFVIYALELKEIEDSNSFMSFDKIARITADLYQDTSVVIDSLLTEFQRHIIRTIYGNPINRPKTKSLISNDIRERFEKIEEYYDGEDNEIELAQIIGVGHKPFQQDQDLFFKGSRGMIAVIPENGYAEKENEIIFWGIQQSLVTFIDSYLARIWEVFDNTKETQHLIERAIAGDTDALTLVEQDITDLTNTASILHQVHRFLLDGIEEIISIYTKYRDRFPVNQLSDFLRVEASLHNSLKRVKETDKILKGINAQIQGLRNYANTLSQVQMRKLSRTMAQNTKNMSQMIHANNRTSEAIDVIELILAGSIILEIVAFAVGEIQADSTFFSKFLPYGVTSTSILFILTLIAWITVVVLLRRSKKQMEIKALKDYIVTFAINKKIDIAKLEKYISTKDIRIKTIEEDRNNKIVSYEWVPDKNSRYVKEFGIERIQLSYNAYTSFLINIEAETSLLDVNYTQMKNSILQDMKENGIFIK